MYERRVTKLTKEANVFNVALLNITLTMIKKIDKIVKMFFMI